MQLEKCNSNTNTNRRLQAKSSGRRRNVMHNSPKSRHGHAIQLEPASTQLDLNLYIFNFSQSKLCQTPHVPNWRSDQNTIEMRKDSVGVIFLTGVKGWFCQMWDDFAQNCFSNEWICTKLYFQMSVFAHKCILFSGVCCAHISTLVIAEENVTNLVQKICYDKKSCRAVRKQAKM